MEFDMGPILEKLSENEKVDTFGIVEEQLMKEVVDGNSLALGVDHPSTHISLGLLGSLLLQKGRPDEAEPLLLRAVEGLLISLGSEHPKTLAAKKDLEAVRAARASETDK